jgi:hypothetical protein
MSPDMGRDLISQAHWLERQIGDLPTVFELSPVAGGILRQITASLFVIRHDSLPYSKVGSWA